MSKKPRRSYVDFQPFKDFTWINDPKINKTLELPKYSDANLKNFALFFYKFHKKRPFLKELILEMVTIIVTDPSEEKSLAAIATLRKLFQDDSKHDLT